MPNCKIKFTKKQMLIFEVLDLNMSNNVRYNKKCI